MSDSLLRSTRSFCGVAIFNCFFACYGVIRILERFIVNEAVDFVIVSEAAVDVVLVLPGAAVDVVGEKPHFSQRTREMGHPAVVVDLGRYGGFGG
jgi:hypothetical protein